MEDEPKEFWLIESSRRRAEAELAMRAARRAHRLDLCQTVATVIGSWALVAIAVALWMIYLRNMH